MPNLNLLLKAPTVCISLFLTTFYNHFFFTKVATVYPFAKFPLGIIAVYLALNLVIILLLQLINFRTLFKPILILLIFISAICSHFIDHYGVPIDKAMIQNILTSDFKEVRDLISLPLFGRIFLMSVIPNLIIYKLGFTFFPFRKQMLLNLKKMGLCLVGIFLIGITQGKFFASFLREHKELRYFTNPTYAIFSATKYMFTHSTLKNHSITSIGNDAKVPATDKERDLIILVLGETARSDRFSVNGYKKKTNPLLEKEDIISFSNFYSCGTSTAESLPCLFSNFGSAHYQRDIALHTENILDVLKHTGDVRILWRDNNSDSKGVALRISYEDFQTPETNPLCDSECRDEGMLSHLQEFIDSTKEKDILIVLHQMGSHGPAYYKRYPKSFEKFTPACHSNELSECTLEEINNSYDNTILYTDYFLSKVISLLKVNSKTFETAMLYVSDHGESLGENGIYLHSLPRFIAPIEQIKIPAIFWFGDSMLEDIDTQKIKKKAHEKYNHDHVFHTLLGLFEIDTKIYDSALDLTR